MIRTFSTGAVLGAAVFFAGATVERWSIAHSCAVLGRFAFLGTVVRCDVVAPLPRPTILVPQT